MTAIVKHRPLSYGNRKGWIPRTLEDYGDGGAFPEIHVAQYPLNMGRKDNETSKTLPITLDAQGRIKYESVINPGGKRNVLARYEDSIAAKIEDSETSRPSPEEIEQITEKTKQALEQVINKRIAASAPKTSSSIQDAQYIKYTPSQQGAQFNSGAQQRIIRLTEMPQDPLEPPKFKHKKLPRGPPSPPVPVMHSPPKKLTVKDQQDWKIPPCISNWKNNKGYTIALDKRLAADGRGLAEVTINDNFAKLSEALYVAERTAREEVSKRSEIEKKLKLKEKEKKEELLRKLAQEARMERTAALMESESGVGPEDEDTKARMERDRIREERRRERERDLRMQRNKSAATRNAERDVSERIALGQAVPQQSSETLYDQRLFNQTQGMSSGFGDDDSYNIYSKPLFQGSSTTFLYRPKKAAEEEFGNEEDLKKLHDTSKFRPDKDFSGVDRSEQKNRSQPVEFEKEEDPFGLNEFLTQAKSSSKGGALDKIGSRGHMHVSSGSTDSLSKRSRIDFQTSSDSKEAKKTKH